jgi:hypothetical protein
LEKARVNIDTAKDSTEMKQIAPQQLNLLSKDVMAVGAKI